MTTTKCFKETEIGLIPEEWEVNNLENSIEELIDYRGKTPNKVSKGIPLITAKVVKAGRIEDPNEFIEEEEYDSWMKRGIPQKGDIVITTEAPLGEVAQLDGKKVALAQRLITLRGKPNYLLNDFLRYLLQSSPIQNEINSKGSGSTVIGIKQSELRKVKLFIPPIHEQKAIAAILSSLDDKIDLNRRMNKTLEAIAQAIFKRWFVDFDFPNEDGKPYRSSGGEMVESELGMVPKGWGYDSVANIIEINPSRSILNGKNSTYLDMASMPTEGYFPYGWTQREFKSGMKFINGDTLLARITPCLENGKTGFVNFLREGEVAFGSTEYIVLRSRLKSFQNLEFFDHYPSNPLKIIIF